MVVAVGLLGVVVCGWLSLSFAFVGVLGLYVRFCCCCLLVLLLFVVSCCCCGGGDVAGCCCCSRVFAVVVL